jgi:hypothetical protein
MVLSLAVIHQKEFILNIEVEYQDIHGVLSHRNYNISKLGLVKHMAIAGQRYAPSSHKILKTIGMFFQFSYFLQTNSLQRDKFSLPPNNIYDPTEKGQFSNIAGKAIADFLAKKIDNSLHTVNYESAMKMASIPISVSRPDLLAFTNNSIFAIEAKGFSKKNVSHSEMLKHKIQSQTGGIPVNYTVASVSYNLYDSVKCKYHDPLNSQIPFDNELLAKTTKKYYSGFMDFLEFGNYKEIIYKKEKFYEIDLLSSKFFDMLNNDFIEYSMKKLLNSKSFKLILPKEVDTYAKNGLTDKTEPFLFDSSNETYIDNDRIGLQLQ